MRPPLHLVDLVEVDLDVLACGCGAQGPGRIVDTDGVGELALIDVRRSVSRRQGTNVNDGLLALDGNLERVPGDVDIQILALVF